MAKWLNSLAGLIMPDTLARRETPPPREPARMIPGGQAAPELCMLASNSDALVTSGWMTAAKSHRRVTQIKVDGINGMYVDGRMVGGREGGPLDCALHCQPGLARLEAAAGMPMVFFGEYSAQDGFNATLADHRRASGDGVFWLYDAVPFDAWVTGKTYHVPIEARLKTLRALFEATDTGLFVGMLDFWLLNGPETAAKAKEVWAAGYEGLISKEPGSYYFRRRDESWFKIKQRFTIPCIIVDTVMKGNKLARVMLIVRTDAGSFRRPLTLASGWSSDDERRIIAAIKRHGDDKLVANIEFELTVGAERSVRGAVWKGIV